MKLLKVVKMNMRNLSCLVAAVAVIGSGAANASTVTLSNIVAQWYDGSPSSNVSYFNNPSIAPQARWGVGANQSGYDFVIASQPIIYDVPPSPTANQVLGKFSHLNFPINSGTSITGIKLRITADVSINSVLQNNLAFNYGFDHWETPNGAAPCADGGTVGVGVNVNGCADRVIANWLADSQDFMIGSDVYTLNVNGFSLDSAGTNPFTSFWTAEGLRNDAYLLANVTLRSDAGGGPSGTIPEPGTLALLGIALTGLAASRSARRARA